MRTLCSLLFTAVVAAGCAGSETGNPFVGDMSTDTHSSDPDQVDVLESAAITVEQAWVVEQPVRFVPLSGCDDGEGTEVPLAVGAVDHAASGARRVAVELDADAYCRVVIELTTATAPIPAGAPAELEGASVLITGTTAAGAPFRIRSAALLVIDVRAMNGGFDLDGDTPNLFLGMDINAWLGALDLDSGTPSGDGTIEIDSSSNMSLLGAFEARFAAGVELFRDLNGSGSVDEAGDTLIARGRAPQL